MNLYYLPYLFAVLVYNTHTISDDDFSHIGGSWIKSAKNINYKDNILCADLRAHKFQTNDMNNMYDMYSYHTSCIKVNKNHTMQLLNHNGHFEVYETNEIFLHKLTFPKGSWHKAAYWPTYFPNSVCAYFLTNTHTTYIKAYGESKTTNMYNEECFDYNEYDYIHTHKNKFYNPETN